MKITFYGYNTFLVESKDNKILIDPGGNFYLFKGWLKSLFPESKWESVTHILVTHGDPDHYWHVDRIAKVSGAPVVCNISMVKQVNGKRMILGPRNKGLAFTTEIENLYTITENETINIGELEITGIKTQHGPLSIKLGPFSKTLKPGPKERIGWGSIGFKVVIGDREFVNLGDTLMHREEWEFIKSPEVLMIPIGGKIVHNTMDEKDAIEVVRKIKPKYVIPCHYNCAGFHRKNANPANDKYFYEEIKKFGIDCIILGIGESFVVNRQ